jgi:hypothetical protein
MSLHSSETTVHVVCNWSYADTAARTGATGLVAADVGKFCHQLDNHTVWMLINHSPVTWVSLSGLHATSHINGTDDIPLATTTSKGLAGALSGKIAQFHSGDGNYYNVPSNSAWFLTNTASDISGYKALTIAVPAGAKTSISVSCPSANTLIEEWAAIPTETPNFIPKQIMYLALRAAKTAGTKSLGIYAKFYKRDFSGTEVEIITSDTVTLPGTEGDVLLSVSIPSTLFNQTDRCLFKLYGTPGAEVGTDPTATIYFEGTSTNQTFSRVDGQGMKYLAYAPGFINALNVDQTTNSQCTVSVGSCRDSANKYNIDVASTLTISLATSGANGLDTGTEVASTPYHVFVCIGSSGVCGLLSLSLTPTLPTGYNAGYRQVGSVINDASSNLIAMKQYGLGRRRVTWYKTDRTNRSALSGGASQTWASVDCTDWVPLSASDMIISAYHRNINDQRYAYVRPNGWTNFTNGTHRLTSYTENGQMIILPSESGYMQYICSASSSAVTIEMLGWIEEF